MARYDKYDPKVGGFRAFLASDWDQDTDLNRVWPVGLNTSGQVVKGAGNTGVIGVCVITRKMKAADEPVDVMTAGEIVEFPTIASPAPAGSLVYAEPASDFEVDVAANVATGSVKIGHTVESRAGRGARLIVRVLGPTATGGSGS
jgi:hypothetical protein